MANTLVLESDIRDLPLSRPEALASKLAELMIEQNKKPGDFIGTLSDLQNTTGFALATVTSAVKLLRERGVMEIRPGRDGGLFVAEPSAVVKLRHTLLTIRHSSESVTDALQVRESLEPLVVQSATESRTDSDVAELRVLLTKLENTRNSFANFMDINWSIHLRIAQICSNELAKNLYIGLLEYVKSETAEFATDDTDWTKNFDHRIAVHKKLIDAIASGSIELAQAAVISHNA